METTRCAVRMRVLELHIQDPISWSPMANIGPKFRGHLTSVCRHLPGRIHRCSKYDVIVCASRFASACTDIYRQSLQIAVQCALL